MKGAHTITIIFAVILAIFAGAFTQRAFAGTGVPKIISYQGRLLDSSGNLLGGGGTAYCFRFSLYNASSGGTQIWPAATASIMTATVANGVFNIGIGDTSAGGDALTYNFQSNDTTYLNVQVATKVDSLCTGGSEVFETLSPRERVVAAGYAINADAVDGFNASTNASGTMIPVIASDTLTLAGVNPQINAVATNTLTLQGGAGTGAIQFFSANNYVTSSTFRMAGMVSANSLQMAVAPSQLVTSSLMALGPLAVRLGAPSGTFIGINTLGIFSGDYLEFENNSSTVLNVASSGQLTIGTSTNVAASLFTVATSSNIFTVLSNGNIGIGTTTPGNQLSIVANAVPAADQLSISNTGFPVATAGVNALQLTYVGGSAGVESGAQRINLTPGTGAGGTWNALRIIAATTTTSTVTMNGIKFDSLGAGGSGLERAIYVDTGWDTALAAAGVPGQRATSSLVRLGNFLSGGNVLGTYLSVNQTAGTGADFLNFQLSSSSVFKVASSGAVSIGAASSSEGQLVFNNALTQFGVTLQANTTTARSFTLTLPNSTGTAGQSLVTDGNGNLSWGSTGFTVIASTTVNKVLAVTMASDTTTGITPSSLSSQVWITANVMASTTAVTSTVGIGVYKTAACGTLVGSVVSSTFLRASTTSPGVFNITLNVVDSPASTTKQNYWLCADYAGGVANLSYAEITLQEIRAGSDVAEVYYAASDTPLTAGDIVSIDPSISDGVKQSPIAYDNTILGVISTQPGVTLGNSDSPSGVQELVALAGRVPIHVTNKNGNIVAGDYLTSSDIPGVAMRAAESGRMVGIAMEDFAPDPSEGTAMGSILVFVNPGWSPGDLTGTTSTASSTFSIGGALQQFFGVIADVGNTIQTFIRASMIAVENLFVKTEVVLPGGTIKVPSGPDQMSGSATLAALSSEIFIANAQVSSSSKIFITPTTLTDVPLVVTSKQDGVGFTVGVTNPQANDISFDWIMTQSYHVGGNDVSWSERAVPVASGGGSVSDANTPSTTPTGSNSSSSPDASSTGIADVPLAPDISATTIDAASATDDAANVADNTDAVITPDATDTTQ